MWLWQTILQAFLQAKDHASGVFGLKNLIENIGIQVVS
jgi:hypothetical protein